MHATSTGKVLLAFSPAGTSRCCDRAPGEQPAPPHADDHHVVGHLEKELALTRDRGYAVCRGEFETLGLGCLGPGARRRGPAGRRRQPVGPERPAHR